jgi:hypothetical protein
LGERATRRHSNDAEGYRFEKKKNLKNYKGNSFACLDIDYLSQIAQDVNVKIGDDCFENNNIVNSLICEEKRNYDKFVEENLEFLLPPNLNIGIDCTPHEVQNRDSSLQTPPGSLKD